MKKDVTTPLVCARDTIDYRAYCKQQANRSKWDKFKYGIWDPDHQQFLGRTGKSWGILFIFYLVFLVILSTFFAICMKSLMYTIDDNHPKWQLSSSLIGTNPGMGYRPMPDAFDGRSVIWYTGVNSITYAFWVNTLDTFLEPYQNRERLPGGGENQQWCDYALNPSVGKVCAVDVNSEAWGPCVHNNNYSYPTSSPCIFLKLNRIYGWLPEYYNDPKSLPDGMPDQVKAYIGNITNENELNTVWMSCEGSSLADQENIGLIEYYPQPGFPGYFYPYTNTQGYLSPLVAIHLVRPKLHTLIKIECRAWAKNVYYRRSVQNGPGSVKFSVMID